jgi:hypothetical protein
MMMKKLIALVLLVFCVAALPPQLPSSFYGEVAGGRIGQVVQIKAGSVTLKSTVTFGWSGKVVYTVDVPTEGYADGTTLTFYVGGVQAGAGVMRMGTNQSLNLTVPSVKPVIPVPCWGWFCWAVRY